MCQSLARQDIPRPCWGHLRGCLRTPLGVSGDTSGGVPSCWGDTSPTGALSSREDVRPGHRKGPCAVTAPRQAAPRQQLGMEGAGQDDE